MSEFNQVPFVFSETFEYGAHKVSITTGEIANQADGAVMVDMDGTIVLVTAVINKEAAPDAGFLRLTVDHSERTYAAGKIPGGFFKREGRPSEREILISRLIDRPCRPLFPDNFNYDIQVVSMVLSVNPEIETDIPAMIGASAALTLSGLPFRGPIGAARVGYSQGQLLLNPTHTQLKTSELDLVVAGTESAVMMVESSAKVLPEQVMLEAVWYGQQAMQTAIQAIKRLALKVNKASFAWIPLEIDASLVQSIEAAATEELIKAYQISNKHQRATEIKRLWEALVHRFVSAEAGPERLTVMKKIYEDLQSKIVRHRIIEGYPRIDGRDTRTVRPLSIRVGVLPRTHGSALFTRGETQALVVTTLGMGKDSQLLESVMGEERDQFMFHYNFPPFCVGEVGQIGSPKRREIGHGKLAKRGIRGVLPSQKEFSYVIRVVSEIMASNGSSSMASVCGASLALMDAGVPIKAPVAGIAMGLIKEENKFAILTDIIGDEDHLGDMDFKVAGTSEGITALQMDIKTDGITKFIMEKALEQALAGRLHILQHMNAVLSAPKTQLSDYAPTIKTMKIETDKIRDVIGRGGSTIRSIIEKTGADIDVKEDGTISVSAVGNAAIEAAFDQIRRAIGGTAVGEIFTGVVTKVLDFGAFVNLMPNKDGFLHVSQIADERVENIASRIKEGDTVKVKVIEIDKLGRVRLTMKPSEF